MKKAVVILLAATAISLVGCANMPTDTKNPDANDVDPIPSLQQNDITYSNANGSWMYDGEKFVSSSANSIILWESKHEKIVKNIMLHPFGGAYEAGSMSNTYNLFDVCGVEYLALNLEFDAPMSVIRWAGRGCSCASTKASAL